MSRLPERPSRAVVQGSAEKPSIVQTMYQVEDRPGWESVRDVLGIFRRHIWLIAIITAISLAFSAWLVTKEVPKYQASAIIRLIDRQPSVGRGTVTEVPVGTVDPVLSELVVLSGRPVLGETVDREGFRLFNLDTGEPASFVDDVEVDLPQDAIGTVNLEFAADHVEYGPESDRLQAAYGEHIAFNGLKFVVPTRPRLPKARLYLVPRERVIDYLMGNLVTIPNQSTGAIQVLFTSTDFRLAPKVVNAVVEVYQKVNAEMERQNVGRRRKFLEEQIRTTDSLLMVAQAGLSSFRSREQSYSAAGRFTAEQGNLVQVEIEQARLQADLRMYENALNRMTQTPDADFATLISLPGLASAPVVGSLYSQLAGYQSEMEAMLAGPWARAPTHPEVRRLNSLIELTEVQLLDAVRSHVTALRAQIGALGSLRGRAVAKMSDLPRTEVEEVSLSQNLSSLQQMANQLRDQYQAVRLEEAAESGLVEIVQPSTRSLPRQSKAWVKILLGLIVGLMAGGGAAVAREMFDESINTPEEIEKMLLVPNLAVIPQTVTYLKEPVTNGDTPRTALESPGSEAYRLLRTNLLFSQGKLRTLVVTSAAPGEGKTMTSVNLAAAYSRQGMKVLLMECDLRRPALARYFEKTNGGDLADVLLDNRSWKEIVQSTGVPRLDVIVAGRSLPRATEFLAGNEMKRLLKELSAEYDIVILDTSPLLVAADAAVLGAIVDGVLLVVRATQTDRRAVEQAVHQLSLVGARVVGTVLNDPEGAATRYGNYYDYSAEYEAQ